MSISDTLFWDLLWIFIGIASVVYVKEGIIDAWRDDPEYRAEVKAIFNEIKRKFTKKS